MGGECLDRRIGVGLGVVRISEGRKVDHRMISFSDAFFSSDNVQYECNIYGLYLPIWLFLRYIASICSPRTCLPPRVPVHTDKEILQRELRERRIYFRLFIVLIHISSSPSFASDAGKLLMAATALSAYS